MTRPQLLTALWLLTDAILFVAVYVLAYFLRVGFIFSSDFPFDRYLLIVVLVAPLWLAVLATTRTFSLTRNQRATRNLLHITYAAVVGAALFSLLYYFTFLAFFSRLLLLVACVSTAIGTVIWHVVFDHIRRRILRRSPPSFPTLIIGVTRESKALIRELHARVNPLTPVAVLDPYGTPEKEISGVPVLGKLQKLEEVLREKRITHLIQASGLEQSLNLLGACRARGITYMLLPSVLGMVERDERIESLEGRPVTVVSPHRTLNFLR